MKQVDLFENNPEPFLPFDRSSKEKKMAVNVGELIGRANQQVDKNIFNSSNDDFEASLQLVKEGASFGTGDHLMKKDSDYGYLTGSTNFNGNEPWIQTYSGRRFNPLNPIPDTIVIQDIAHALSMQCRYNGHCNEFYSVAQHSVIVSYLCDEADAFDGLLHDATEAYIADISSPLKRSEQFSFYRDIETNLQKAVSKRFNISAEEKPSVKRADMLALATEAKCLLNCRPDWILPVEPAPFNIVALGPKEAKELFMNRFFDLLKLPHVKKKYSSKLDKMLAREIESELNKP